MGKRMKVSIVGMGKVGSTVAFALSLRGCVREMVLVGRNHAQVVGDAMDIAHAQSFVEVPTKVVAGRTEDTAGSDVIVICASVPTPSELVDRADLGPGNARLMRELLPPLAKLSPNAILVMVSNPVDVLTRFAMEFTGFPWRRVIGTGTLIDSVRLRYELSQELGIHIQDLRAYILGEHGGTQFAAMSIATAGGELIEATPKRRELIGKVVGSGVDIFQHKGYTNYGIALATVMIVESILLDSRHTVPVSVAIDDYLGIHDVCLSLPVVVGREGIERILHPTLNDAEVLALKASAACVKEQIERARNAL
jgi:L-lactate dehydrogenase